MAGSDLIVLYTDGVVEEEGPNGDIFGQDRLSGTLCGLMTLPPKEMLAKVLDEVRRFAGHEDFSDDVCLLGVEVKWIGNEKGS